MAVQVEKKNDRVKEKEERILEVAKRRFLHYGYKKTTVDEIGALADLYCQFGDSTVILVIGDPEQVSTPLAELNLGEVIRLDLERFGE